MTLEACEIIDEVSKKSELLGKVLSDADTTFKWVDTSILHSRRVKPKKEVEEMDPSDVDLFCPSIIDTHYPNRPCEINDLLTELIETKRKEFGEENPELPDDNLLGTEALVFRRVEALRAMQDFHDAANLQLEHDLAWLEMQLNPDQRRVYEKSFSTEDLSSFLKSLAENPTALEAAFEARKAAEASSTNDRRNVVSSRIY
ncbi:unnamed protein product [Bemisia tabaci]|uniref:Uncharacterized protein n=1 Tax=Bemisia tabaci TaxID=7038 RepID=A0A9P0F3D2_BEMTA|nr:unnamed protein product [Bemisia tabaci]